ncbi:MAG TPA: histidine kinase dimerization/phospho-acceptor domain-containing protein [Gemmatimonadaceae bacterium]|nr:histidine kinase dimerization/phospho-acceptor domain-containing protein [Gemmatimonadaceae bacterium]
MDESYSGDDASGAGHDSARARAIITQLLPGVDAALLVSALEAERAGAAPRHRDDEDPSSRELRRVRRQFAVGAAARSAQHELNNPLTALLAEAQLLELEPLSAEHRAAATRIVELARRLAAAVRRLDPAEQPAVR